MKIFLAILVLLNSLFCYSFVSGHVNHYNNLKYLEYELFFNDNPIGSHTFNFIKKGDLFYVKTSGQFKINKLGIILMDYETKTEEIYKNGQLIEFKSKTTQNDKEKYVNLKLNKKKNLFEVNGSSFNGDIEKTTIVGSWWNHEIINKNKQISAVSGRIMPQKVRFLGKKNINLNNKKINSIKFHFLSDDDRPMKKKKINLHVWYDAKTLIWLKMSYEKLGLWEYRLKKQLFY